MKYYTARGNTLRTMAGPLRLILGLYCSLTLLGFWVAGLKYVVRGMTGAASTERYYLGEPGEGLLSGTEPKDLSFLTDVTHPHLFTVPLVLLVLCHLVQLGRGPQRPKTLLYVTGFASSTLTFGVPWLLAWLPSLAFLVPLSGALLVLCGTALCLWPIADLLARPRESVHPR